MRLYDLLSIIVVCRTRPKRTQNDQCVQRVKGERCEVGACVASQVRVYGRQAAFQCVGGETGLCVAGSQSEQRGGEKKFIKASCDPFFGILQ